MTAFRNIVLTGASGGFGAAIAARLSAANHTMLLFGRNAERLDRVKTAAEAAGAEVYLSRAAIEDHAAVASAISAFDRQHPVDLFVANAGVKCGNEAGLEPAGQFERVVEVNLTGTIASIQAILPSMQERHQGRIAIVSSLAAMSPQGCLISYSATKSALASYGVALRRSLRGSGVGVSVIMPGFMDTPMTDRHKGPTPFLLTPERAADLTIRGLRAGWPKISFPWQLALLIRVQNLLPTSFADRAAQSFDAIISPDADQLAAESDLRRSDALDTH